MTKKAAVSTLSRIKARLDPRLNEPYFATMKSGGGCVHSFHGVRLDETTQRAYCKSCGAEIALFDALMNYHHAEQRLVATLEKIEKHKREEEAKKLRDRERRPYVREVRGRKARKDMTLKAEPIIGYELELECGHKHYMPGERRLNRVTCHECKNAAMVAAAKAKGKP